MKIEVYNKGKFRNAEFVSLGNDILAITKNYDWVGLNIAGFYTQVESSLENLVEQLNKLNTVAETLDVEIADEHFNNAWRAFKYMCKGYALSSDKAERDAAQCLINLGKVHGYNMHLESYQEQNAKAKMFLVNCENVVEVKAAIQKLSFENIIAAIKNGKDSLGLAIADRNNKNVNQKRENDTKLFRKELAESLSGMFKYLEAMSGISADGELDSMIRQINERIQKLEMSGKLRGSRKPEELVEKE